MGRPSWRSALGLTIVVGACGTDTVAFVDQTGSGTAGDTAIGEAVTLSVYRGVDILFVIDNSGSMLEEQITLALGLGELLEALPPDVRIGVTTTDYGNPWCEDTTPEEGALVATSCRARTHDFVFAGAQPPPTEWPCLDHCPEAWAEIALPEPWVEVRPDGDDNLPEGLSPEVALACILPQGINGCGFEQPLESIASALHRSSTPGDPAEGFVRPDALLAIVVLTDEVDCSYNPEHASIFAAESDRVFWEDPDAATPSSAVCWNAGVACTGSPDGYDECHPVDLGVDGQPVAPGTAESEAVLRPVASYLHALRELEIAKQRLAPDHEILLALIAGVGEGGAPVYADTLADPDFQDTFGIGPGCQSATGRAVPVVRMLQLAEAFRVGDRSNAFSVCAEDYGPALAEISDAITAQVGPACVRSCVAPGGACEVWTEVLDADGASVQTPVPACAPGGALPAGDTDACFVTIAGADLSARCRAQGGGVELAFTHRDGRGFPHEARVIARCEPPTDSTEDCAAPA